MRRRGSSAAIVSAAILGSGVAAEFSDPLRSGGTGPVMVRIEADTFEMGWFRADYDHRYVKGTREQALPRREVMIETFAMSRDEVTVAEFSQFVRRTLHLTAAERSGAGRRPLVIPRPRKGQCVHTPWTGNKPGPMFTVEVGLTWREPANPSSDLHPVVCIARSDALAYAEWLAKETGHPYRLPSEAEWEFAARAGRSDFELRPIVEDSDFETHNSDDVFAQPRTVSDRLTNPFGLRGMGSYLEDGWYVAEWVADCWNPGYPESSGDNDPILDGDCDKGVVRGSIYRPFAGRNAMRWNETTDTALGFRVVRSPLSGPMVVPGLPARREDGG